MDHAVNQKSPALLKACGAFLLMALSPGAWASTPLLTHDLNPLTLVYGLPLASPAGLLSEGGQQFTVSFNISNTLNYEATTNETLLVDGETWQLNLVYLYAISDNWTTRIRVPLSGQSGGQLDDLIDDYHDLFGFPQGDRPSFDNDQLVFSLERNSTSLINYSTSDSAAGDISLDFAYRLSDNAVSASSLWFSIKLPSGNVDALSGSGSEDFAIWYALDRQASALWSHYYNIGYLRTGHSELLSAIQVNDILFGTAGIELRYFRNVALNVQFDFHSRFYDSETEFLGDSIQISYGGRFKLSPRSRFDLLMIEDIQVGASPDVSFQFAYSHRF